MNEIDVVKAKSFWERTEGTTGMVFLSIATVLGAVGAYAALPFLLTLLSGLFSALGAAIGCSVLAVGLYAFWSVIANKRFRFIMSAWFKAGMRSFTGMLITIDPIGILKNFISEKRKELESVDAQLGKLKGQISYLTELIHTKKVEFDRAMKLAAQARKQNDKLALAKLGRMAGRRGKSTISYEHMLAKLEILYRTLSKMRDVASVVIDDTVDEVQELEVQFKAAKTTEVVLKNSRAIIGKGGDAWELKEQAAEYIKQDFSEKMGEVEDFLRISDEFTSQLDLENGMFEDEALAKLEAWEKRADSLLLPEGEKQHLLSTAADPEQPLSLSLAFPDDEPARVPTRPLRQTQ